MGFDHLCVACHGFSALPTARRGDRTTSVLFDVGPYGEVWLANAERLAVDLAGIEVLFLDLFLASGDIPRRTSYETGLTGHHRWRADAVTLDAGIHDERFLAAGVRGRGTTVLTACSHAGVVNVGLEARRLRPREPIDLLLGGYHLAGAAVEDRIEATVRDLANLVAPSIVAPGHCTGWRAAAALVHAFGPTGCAPSVVGTRYLLNST